LIATMTEREPTPLAEIGTIYLNFSSGLEACNAKTKGYTNNLLLLYLLGTTIAKDQGKSTIAREIRQQLDQVIAEIPQTIQQTEQWVAQHREWVLMPQLIVIATKADQGAADEGALKLAETLCIPAFACELEEFSH